MKRILLFFLSVILFNTSQSQTVVRYNTSSNNFWTGPSNWNSGLVPTSTQIAEFENLPQGNGINNGCNINFGDATTNNGMDGQIVGAVRVLATRTYNMNIGNSSPSVDGTLTLAGVTVNGTANVVIDNQLGSSYTFSINNSIVGNSRVMNLAFLPANAVILQASNSTLRITTEVTNAQNIILEGGTLQLDRTGGATLPSTASVKVNSGTLMISRNQTLENLDLAPGATLLIDGNTTLTVNGTFTHRGATITKSSGSSNFVYGPDATLEYAGVSGQTVTTNEWPTTGSPKHIVFANASGVTLPANRAVTGNVTISGPLDLGTSSTVLTANSINVANGGSVKIRSLHNTDGVTAQLGTPNLTFASGSLVEYVGAGLQYTSARSYGGVAINNNSGLTLTGNITVNGNLSIPASSNVILSGRTLTLGGTVSGAGTLRGSTTSSLAIAATGTVGTIGFDQTTDNMTNALSNLSVSAGNAALGSKLNIHSVINVSGGTLNLDNKNVVLKSTAANTARVARVTGTLIGATNVTVERYMPNNARRYRLITPGVTTTGSIRDNWMEGAMNTEFWGANANKNPNPGYGTHITGAGHNSNGFDVTQTNNSSLFTFNHTTGSWVAVPNTTATLDANKGYLIFVRGDRSVNMTLTGAPITLGGTSTTLRATGSLKIGNQSFSSLASSGAFSLVTNPYASPVSWNSIFGNNSSKFENYYTYWDPKVGTRGSFVTVTNSGIKSNFSSNASVEIQGGQAFFVKTKSGISSPSLTVREQDKSTTSNLNVFRTGSQTEEFYASLFFHNEAERINADGVMVAYKNSFSKDVDDNDAIQIANWDEDIAIARSGKNLSIETRPLITSSDTIQLVISRLKVQQYEWQFDPFNFNAPGMEAFLVDNFENKKIPISLASFTIVPFTVTSDTASSASNRFYVTFSTATPVVPVKVVSISVKKSNEDNIVKWSTTSVENLSHFVVEYSIDERTFTKLAVIHPNSSNSGETTFEYTHKKPNSNLSFYRVKMVEKNESVSYSKTVLLKGDNINFNISHVFPNPFADELSMNVHSQISSNGHIYLYDLHGRTIRKLPFNIIPGSNSVSLQNLKALGSGTYIVSVKTEAYEFSIQVLKAQ